MDDHLPDLELAEILRRLESMRIPAMILASRMKSPEKSALAGSFGAHEVMNKGRFLASNVFKAA